MWISSDSSNDIKHILTLRPEYDSRAQYAVLQHLGIQKFYAIVGFSMGGQQVSDIQFTWPLLYSILIFGFVGLLLASSISWLCQKVSHIFQDARSLMIFTPHKRNRYVCICGSAKTSPHNQWSDRIIHLRWGSRKNHHGYSCFWVASWKDRKPLWLLPRISITVIIRLLHNMVHVHSDAFIAHGRMDKR